MSDEGPPPRKPGTSRAGASKRRGWRRAPTSSQGQPDQGPSSRAPSSEASSSQQSASQVLPAEGPSGLRPSGSGPAVQGRPLPGHEPPGQVIFDRLKKEHTDLFHEHSAFMDTIGLYQEYVKRLRRRPNALLRTKTRHERKQLLDKVEADIKVAMTVLHRDSHKSRIGYAILGPWFLPYLGLGDQFYASQEEIDREVGKIKANHARGKEILEPIKFFLGGEGDYFPSARLNE